MDAVFFGIVISGAFSWLTPAEGSFSTTLESGFIFSSFIGSNFTFGFLASSNSRFNLATDAATVAKTALETATADSAVLDFDPINWLVTAGLGIASLVAGTKIKAHTEKFITPPEIQKNYSVQLDG